jgi:hypothetical protein
VLWMLSFSDRPSAEQFAAVYASLLDRLLGRSTVHRIDFRGNAVLVLIGESARHFAELSPAIWSASTIHRAPPTKPSLTTAAVAADIALLANH